MQLEVKRKAEPNGFTMVVNICRDTATRVATGIRDEGQTFVGVCGRLWAFVGVVHRHRLENVEFACKLPGIWV